MSNVSCSEFLYKQLKLLVQKFGFECVGHAFSTVKEVMISPSLLDELDELDGGIARIKYHRKVTGSGLRESKGLIELYYKDAGEGPRVEGL